MTPLLRWRPRRFACPPDRPSMVYLRWAPIQCDRKSLASVALYNYLCHRRSPGSQRPVPLVGIGLDLGDIPVEFNAVPVICADAPHGSTEGTTAESIQLREPQERPTASAEMTRLRVEVPPTSQGSPNFASVDEDCWIDFQPCCLPYHLPSSAGSDHDNPS